MEYKIEAYEADDKRNVRYVLREKSAKPLIVVGLNVERIEIMKIRTVWQVISHGRSNKLYPYKNENINKLNKLIKK
jgi:hypothetical protein